MRPILPSLFSAVVAFSVLLGPAGAAWAAPAPIQARESCAEVSAPGFARCFALVRTDTRGAASAPGVGLTVSGYGPGDLDSAYHLSPSGGVGQTVAIVDAFDDPNAASDLSAYRAHFGLPPCTTANGCFKKVNQSGITGGYPAPDVGWSEEISLDLDMVSAICPNCHILLVEATNNSLTNLGAAVNEAAKLGATEISNSYGGPEYAAEAQVSATYYNHPGIAITVSAGDGAYAAGTQFPAASPYVTAVGGTSLVRNARVSRGWSETVWSTNAHEGTGSGCSAYIAKPNWQADKKCGKRTVADVSAVADPATGVAVYDSYGAGGWLVFGGTSVASPIVAGVYALSGNARSISSGQYPYAHASSLYDVTQGSNGTCGSYLCTAGVGFDGPTGLGTPNGIGGF